MSSHRIEISLSGRAKCASTLCSKEGVKIAKGELRCGTLVVTPDFQNWKYRHWGCVTPTVLHNWWETAVQDLELIDGFDDLPKDCQIKVERALKEGHVADDDWNGDIECNRFDPNNKSQGMFLKGKRLKEKQAAEAAESGAEPSPVKKTGKKRGRKDEDVDDEPEAKPAKKSRGKKASAEDDGQVAAPVNKTFKSKKNKASIDDDDEDIEATAPRAKKPKAKAVKAEDEDIEVKPKRGRAKKEAQEDELTAPNKTKGRAKKQETSSDNGPVETTPKLKTKRKKGVQE